MSYSMQVKTAGSNSDSLKSIVFSQYIEPSRRLLRVLRADDIGAWAAALGSAGTVLRQRCEARDATKAH
jgi:hypothetical protein